MPENPLPLLVLEQVHTDIGRYHILNGIDLAVQPGQVTMLLGRNGAGKSTTLRTIMGLWRARAGRIRFDGRDIASLPTADIARLGLAYVPEEMAIFGGLKVRENLLLASSAKGLDRSRLERVFGWFPALRDKWDATAGMLSGGQKQMLAIARALVEPRRLLIIDEPTKGLSPAVVDQCVEALLALKAEERTAMLVVEQNLDVAIALGDRVAVMDEGRIIHAGAMADLAADEVRQRRLLGLQLETSP